MGRALWDRQRVRGHAFGGSGARVRGCCRVNPVQALLRVRDDAQANRTVPLERRPGTDHTRDSVCNYDFAMREISAVTLANGPTLSYSEQGDRSGSALVLLPVPTDSWRSYEPVLERLRTSTRTIAVSLRGHGDSDKPATGYRVEDFAADVVGLLDALDIERAVLAGHSGSCLVARRVALDLPERVAGLVLEASPTTLVGHSGLTTFVESDVAGLVDPIDPDFARSFIVDTSSGEVAPEVLEQLVSELLNVPPASGAKCSRNCWHTTTCPNSRALPHQYC
jgi:hypothetical protein